MSVSSTRGMEHPILTNTLFPCTVNDNMTSEQENAKLAMWQERTDGTPLILFSACTDLTNSFHVGWIESDFIALNYDDCICDDHAQGGCHTIGILIVNCILYEL